MGLGWMARRWNLLERPRWREVESRRFQFTANDMIAPHRSNRETFVRSVATLHQRQSTNANHRYITVEFDRAPPFKSISCIISDLSRAIPISPLYVWNFFIVCYSRRSLSFLSSSMGSSLHASYRVSNFLGILCLILYEWVLLFHGIFSGALEEICSDLLKDFRVFTGYFVRPSFVNFIFSDDLFDLASV